MPRVLSGRSTRKRGMARPPCATNERWKQCVVWRDIGVDPRPPVRIGRRVIFSSNINNKGLIIIILLLLNVRRIYYSILVPLVRQVARQRNRRHSFESSSVFTTASATQVSRPASTRSPAVGRVDRYTLAGLAPLESTGSLAIPNGRFARPVDNRELG